jgi:predicted dehydrogenase
MIGVAVLGYGYWGPNLVRNLLEVPEAQLVTLCDPDAERTKLAARRAPGLPLASNAQDVMRSPEVDAVVVATPLVTHYPLARAALEAGKHVLIEKPFTSTSEQAARLIDLAACRDRVLMVDHTGAYSDAMRTIRDLVQTRRLGDLYYYDSVRISLGRFQPNEDVLWDLAVHDLGILDALRTDQPIALAATGASHPVGARDSVAYLTLFYDDGMIAHIHANWLSPVKVRRMLIGGSHSMVMFDDLEPSEKVRVYEASSVSEDGEIEGRVDYRTGDVWTPRLDVREPLQLSLRHFVDCIRTGARPLTDGEAGRRVVALLECASQSLASQGRPVDLTPEQVA